MAASNLGHRNIVSRRLISATNKRSITFLPSQFITEHYPHTDRHCTTLHYTRPRIPNRGTEEQIPGKKKEISNLDAPTRSKINTTTQPQVQNQSNFQRQAGNYSTCHKRTNHRNCQTVARQAHEEGDSAGLGNAQNHNRPPKEEEKKERKEREEQSDAVRIDSFHESKGKQCEAREQTSIGARKRKRAEERQRARASSYLEQRHAWREAKTQNPTASEAR